MRKLLLLISAALVIQLASCGKAEQNDYALLKAEECYDSLVAGNYAYFVRATYMPDTIPPSYREQLETNMKMFMARQQEEHKGIVGVEPLRSQHDTIASAGGKADIHIANAFLMLTYGDSLKEEIVVPMIEHGGSWLMR